MNNELERIWKEMFMAYKLLCQHLHRGTEENHRSLNSE
jgi:hypothetical protein